MKFNSDLDGLIEALKTIRDNTGNGDIPVTVNCISDRNVALRSICYDNCVGGEEMVYLEVDLEDRAESSAEVELYSQTGLLENLVEENSKPRRKREVLGTFETDLDKMLDFLTLPKEDFLQSYSYLAEKDYDDTADLFTVTKENDMSDENQDKVWEMAHLMRRIENHYQEQISLRETVYDANADDLKWAVTDYIGKNYTEDQQELFADVCTSMGV